ncbi:MAG TPA: hypothetical protein DDX54_04625 [Rhodospirillaceae bacterium]|jgi:membrane protein YdbS with pleckstrin-like domain|nr:hypothetical protein [Rhodospirillaceae bacterium]
MFCSQCGSELGDGAAFCAKCGTRLSRKDSTEREIVNEDRRPIMVLKPVFVVWVALSRSFGPAITASLVAVFTTIPFAFLLQALDIDIPIWIIVSCASLIIFLCVFLCVYYLYRKTYEKTEYRFFSKNLEYYEGFLMIERKIIKYDRVTEVNLRRGFLQKLFGLGTIILSTPASGHDLQAKSGVRIRDIRDAEKIYDKLAGLIG